MSDTTLIEAVLCDISALEYWRAHSEELHSSYSRNNMLPAKKQPLNIGVPSAALADDLSDLCLVDRNDIHLLVSSGENRRKIQGVTCTVYSGALPKNSIVRTFGRKFVACPELMFVQLARHTEFSKLLEIGHEICGTYRKHPDGTRFWVDPLTSVTKLKSYILRATDMHGSKKALQATNWIADGSASPAETALSIMFRLPYRYGGYGLGKPLLNHEIKLNETAARLLGRDTISPDLFWLEGKHPAEYDGTLYHSTREQAEYDERRRNAYTAMGMTVTVIRPHHLRSIDLLDEVANSIRKNTGIRQGTLPKAYALKHYKLFQDLFAYWIALQHGYRSDDELAQEAARYAGSAPLW